MKRPFFATSAQLEHYYELQVRHKLLSRPLLIGCVGARDDVRDLSIPSGLSGEIYDWLVDVKAIQLMGTFALESSWEFADAFLNLLMLLPIFSFTKRYRSCQAQGTCALPTMKTLHITDGCLLPMLLNDPMTGNYFGLGLDHDIHENRCTVKAKIFTGRTKRLFFSSGNCLAGWPRPGDGQSAAVFTVRAVNARARRHRGRTAIIITFYEEWSVSTKEGFAKS
jgi:hypothetical protein